MASTGGAQNDIMHIQAVKHQAPTILGATCVVDVYKYHVECIFWPNTLQDCCHRAPSTVAFFRDSLVLHMQFDHRDVLERKV